MVGSTQSKRYQLVMSALEQWHGSLMRYAARMLGDREGAEDVVQHAFLQLFRQSDGQFPKHPKPWLFKVCRNRILDTQRLAGRNSETFEVSDQLPSSAAPDPAVLAERKDLGAWLQTLVDLLPLSQREVIALWSQGFRYGQIAEITDQSEGAVRVKVHRGFVRIREHPAVRALLTTEGAGGRSVNVAERHTGAGDSLAQKDKA